MGGPRVRTDIVDVYVFRRVGGGGEVLQLRRSEGPFAGTWHPVMGHVRDGETAVGCAVRELGEEVGLEAWSEAVVGMWQLGQVHPYYLADRDEIVLSPRFAVEVVAGWAPALDAAHDGHRWVPVAAEGAFMWPGQRAAVGEIRSGLLAEGSGSREGLRIRPTGR